MSKHNCTRRFGFDSGHRVLNHESKCLNVHGHRYTADVTVEALELDSVGRVVDFGALKALVGDWIDDKWDHGYIHHSADGVAVDLKAMGLKTYEMPDGMNPTAENMVEHLAGIVSGLLSDLGLRVVHVRLYETPNCWADWGAE